MVNLLADHPPAALDKRMNMYRMNPPSSQFTQIDRRFQTTTSERNADPADDTPLGSGHLGSCLKRREQQGYVGRDVGLVVQPDLWLGRLTMTLDNAGGRIPTEWPFLIDGSTEQLYTFPGREFLGDRR